ncbi:uncharacterized protein LOC123291396 [Chrysoperla carnea]|uniref:uncharacterized protein LOC123291396 n=1 Tax=Chrysoperla carnea TaxID=189513 RepID=UPI001D086BF6|nr:uncharacterized protein LOC123291396 [Chrysoperla carnea]
MKRINDTLNSLNTKAELLKDIEDCMMEFEMAQLKDGEYNHDKLTFELNCCDFLESDWNVYRAHSTDGDHGNLPEHCDNDKFPKNTYVIKDALMDESPNVELFKLGKWRADFKMNSGKTNIIQLYFYSHSSMDVERFLNNEYKKTGLLITGDMCDMISDDDLNVFKKFMMDGVHGNLPECEGTFPKGKYFVKDAIASGELRKEVFLPGKWKAQYKAKTKDDVAVLIVITRRIMAYHAIETQCSPSH